MFIVLIYIYFISTLQQNHIILLSFIIFILNLYVYSYSAKFKTWCGSENHVLSYRKCAGEPYLLQQQLK
jgi:hypothetical protein